MLKRAVLSFKPCAPFFMLMLLTCVAFSGAASGRASTGNVFKQDSKPDTKTPETGISSVQRSGGAYLGVYLGDVNEDRARELSLTELSGAVIGRVEEGSPAAKAGLQENDVILSFNDQRIQNRAQFHRLLLEASPGKQAALKVHRAGRTQDVEVILGQRRIASVDDRRRLFSESDALLALAEERRKQAEELQKQGDAEAARRLFEEEKDLRDESTRQRTFVERLLHEGKIQESDATRRPGIAFNLNRVQVGVNVSPLNAQLAGYFNAPNESVLVTEVRAGELGERAGLRAGDCIVSINGESIKSASEMNRLVNQKNTGEVEFIIVRERTEQSIKIKLDQN
jgi:C-terminal processing protease CtpA/Prc